MSEAPGQLARRDDQQNGSLATKASLASDPVYQRASVSLKVGKHTRLSTEAKLTSGGLLAIGGLVSAILLSTAVLVHTAVRESRRGA